MFRHLVPFYIKDCDQIWLIYDTNNINSVLDIERVWIVIALEYASLGMPMVLVGNKIEEGSLLTANTAKRIAARYDMRHILISAKTG